MGTASSDVRRAIDYGHRRTIAVDVLGEDVVERFEDAALQHDCSVCTTAEEKSAFRCVRRLLAYNQLRAFLPDMPVYLDLLREQFGDISRLRVVDVGCGVGDLGGVLSELGLRVTLLTNDQNEHTICYWRYYGRCNHVVGPVDIMLWDGYPEQLRAHWIIDHWSLEHFDCIRDVCERIAASLPPGGLFTTTFEREIAHGDRSPAAIQFYRSGRWADWLERHFFHVADRPFGVAYRRRAT